MLSLPVKALMYSSPVHNVHGDHYMVKAVSYLWSEKKIYCIITNYENLINLNHISARHEINKSNYQGGRKKTNKYG